MSDLKSILDATKRIESILEQHCGGHGRGMHEKLSTATVAIPEELVKRVRYIASVRNKVVHEAGYDIADMPAFLATCTRTAQALQALPTVPAARNAHRPRRRLLWWGVWLLALLALLWMWLVPHRSHHAPAPQAPATSHTPPLASTATSPAAAPTPAASATANSASSQPAPAPAASAAVEAAAPAAPPVQLSQLKLSYQPGPFGDQEAHIMLTVHNTSATTLAQLHLHARLYVNGEARPMLDTATSHRSHPVFVHLGERGLRPGEQRTVQARMGRMDGAPWQSPDVLNASSRRLDVALHTYTNGLNHTVAARGPTVSTGNVPTGRQAASAAADTPTDVRLSAPRIRYVKGAFGDMEPHIEVTVHNHTGRTMAHADVAARLYLNGESAPALSAPSAQRDEAFFAHFGAQGLQPGQSRTVTLGTSHLSQRSWHAPDAINATSRRVELAVLRYTDGRGQPVTVHANPSTARWK